MIEQETPVKQERRKRLEDADYDALCDFLEENGVRVFYKVASPDFIDMDEIIFECDSQERAFEIGEMVVKSGYPMMHLIGIWGYTRDGKHSRRSPRWRICL